ncbi:hypothetical protein [Spirosoma koreense]
MLVTICTLRQLPQAFALADSYLHHTAKANANPVLIGLADDPTHLPAGFTASYPILPVSEFLSADQVTALSAVYTPTEFAAAIKPVFIQEVFRRYPDAEAVLYADPNIQFLASTAALYAKLASANALLTPFITHNPQDVCWPDEKFFQNVGLYSSDFLGFRRSAETDRLLNWWDDRVRERAYVDFCGGFCLDQLWLMHVPVYFQNVVTVRNPGWHVALWNLPERQIRSETANLVVDGPAGKNQPLQFVNFKGLLHADEGFFPHQNRLRLTDRPDVARLLAAYRQALNAYSTPNLSGIRPTYGLKPEPVVLRGWRQATANTFRRITRYIDTVYLPRLR